MSKKQFEEATDEEIKGPEKPDKAIQKLLDERPRFGAFLSNCNRKKSKKVPTCKMGWTGSGFEMSYNPEFLKRCELEMQKGIIKHECYHAFMKHYKKKEELVGVRDKKDFNELDEDEKREAKKNLKKFNIAADMAINPWIHEFKELDEDILMPEKFDLPENKSTKWYYKHLPEEELEAPSIATIILPDDVDIEDITEGDNDSETGCGVNIDVEDAKPDDEEEGEASSSGSEGEEDEEDEESSPNDGEEDFDDEEKEEDGAGKGEIDEERLKDAELKEAVKEGGGSGRGEGPGEFKDTIERLEPDDCNLPWSAIMSSFFRHCGSYEPKEQMKFRDRRYKTRPAIRAKRRMELLIGIDTSGSVQRWYIKKAFSALEPINNFSDITILQCDTQIRDEQKYRGDTPDIKGRGGTSFEPIFNYYEKNRSDYSGIIYFTDGHAPVPEEKIYPVLWIYPETGYSEADWGMTTVIEED